MKPEHRKIYDKLREAGLTPEQEEKVLLELNDDRTHDMPIIGGRAWRWSPPMKARSDCSTFMTTTT